MQTYRVHTLKRIILLHAFLLLTGLPLYFLLYVHFSNGGGKENLLNLILASPLLAAYYIGKKCIFQTASFREQDVVLGEESIPAGQIISYDTEFHGTKRPVSKSGAFLLCILTEQQIYAFVMPPDSFTSTRKWFNQRGIRAKRSKESARLLRLHDYLPVVWIGACLIYLIMVGELYRRLAGIA
ncbi:hypothetical protein [Neisseria sp.]|uniref:hypothetical protein n=1 Tax=Neisseria sp. TaxID=192066 RepID=UPI0035A05FB7